VKIPALVKLIRDEFTELSGSLRVCLPARVHSYDSATGLAAVQPLLKRRFYAETAARSLPIINNVPVVHPRTAKAAVRLPVSKGDICVLVFSDRSLERWVQADGSEQDPNDSRQHHYSDAYAILGGYPKGNKWPSSNPDALEIVVKPGTRVTLGNGSDDLLAICYEAMTQLKAAADAIKLLTVSGVQGGTGTSGVPVNAAAFQAVSDAVNSQLAKLANLKV
jgi:Phage protein Gp138 N-terminal domain